MKYLIPLLFLIGCQTTCYDFKEPEQKVYIKPVQPVIIHREFIDMGGWSSISSYEFQQGLHIEKKRCTSTPRVRVTKRLYKHFVIKMFLDANNDTGRDRISIFHSDSLIFQKNFFESQEIEVSFSENSESKLTVIVDNESLKSAGAFEARIRIKEIIEK